MVYICQFVGGPLDGFLPLDAVEKMTDKRTEDLSAVRARGGCVHRAELDSKPVIDGYCGPMWDGTRAGDIAMLRYETWDVYDMLSR